MKNSVKQMLRTPWKTGLFCLMIILSVALVVVGLNLWRSAEMNLKQADAAFVTIGTVQQRASTMQAIETWDAGLKENTYWNIPVYDAYVPLTALQIDGVEYISGPEQRPFYSANVPDHITYKLKSNEIYSSFAVVEFVPVDDCVPSGPVEVDIVNVLFGYDLDSYRGRRIKFCDHYTENPKPLKRGKTYIAYIYANFSNIERHENLNIRDYEYEYAAHKFYLGQEDTWEEVYDGFYETTAGQQWVNYCNALMRFHESTVPVTPTQDTQLLQAFHSGQAMIVKGRDISQDEYNSGAKVCLISQNFAEMNGIWAGDTIKLGLYNINYKNTAVDVLGFSGFTSDLTTYLNSNDDPYEVFEEETYTIVGVYYHPYVGGITSGYELSPNEVIVPAKSIVNSPGDNVVATGPMQGKNTSFRIPNGNTEAFMEAFSKIPESKLLEIQFYDNGYEQFAAGLKNLSLIGLILFCVGLASGVAVLSLVLYFYIVKQRKRTAVERALGMSKRQCAASLLLGILLLTALGSTAGCAVGASIGGKVQERVLSEGTYFSTDYSRGLVNSGEDGKEADLGPQESGALLPSVLTVTGTLLLTLALASVLIRKNLGIAPILLLSAKGDE